MSSCGAEVALGFVRRSTTPNVDGLPLELNPASGSTLSEVASCCSSGCMAMIIR